jgi:hypothetical protein
MRTNDAIDSRIVVAKLETIVPTVDIRVRGASLADRCKIRDRNCSVLNYEAFAEGV